MIDRISAAAPDYRHARRLLLLLHWGIGDTVMQRPMIAALRRAAPGAAIVAMGADPAVEVLDTTGTALSDGHRPAGAPSLQVATYHSLGVRHFGQPASPEVEDALHAWLAQTGPYDFIFDARHAPTAVREALWALGVPTIESDPKREREALSAGAGCQRAWLEAASAGWRIPIDPDASLRLNPPAWARREAELYLESQGLADDLPVAISPVASLGLKRWPDDRFAEIGDRLIDSARAPLLIFAGADADAARQVQRHMSSAQRTIIVERRHLLETAALLQRSRVLVCNDTGLLHIAAAVGTPVVSIHGPTSPNLYRPRFPWARALGGTSPECPHRRLEHLDLAGCWQDDTCLIGNESCTLQVSVDDVWSALCSLIPLSVSQGASHPSHRKAAGTHIRH